MVYLNSLISKVQKLGNAGKLRPDLPSWTFAVLLCAEPVVFIIPGPPVRGMTEGTIPAPRTTCPSASWFCSLTVPDLGEGLGRGGQEAEESRRLELPRDHQGPRNLQLLGISHRVSWTNPRGSFLKAHFPGHELTTTAARGFWGPSIPCSQGHGSKAACNSENTTLTSLKSLTIQFNSLNTYSFPSWSPVLCKVWFSRRPALE